MQLLYLLAEELLKGHEISSFLDDEAGGKRSSAGKTAAAVQQPTIKEKEEVR